MKLLKHFMLISVLLLINPSEYIYKKKLNNLLAKSYIFKWYTVFKQQRCHQKPSFQSLEWKYAISSPPDTLLKAHILLKVQKMLKIFNMVEQNRSPQTITWRDWKTLL